MDEVGEEDAFAEGVGRLVEGTHCASDVLPIALVNPFIMG